MKAMTRQELADRLTMGNNGERWGRTGKDGKTSFAIVVPLYSLRQVSRRDVIYDPFQRLFPSVPTSSATRSDDTLGG